MQLSIRLGHTFVAAIVAVVALTVVAAVAVNGALAILVALVGLLIAAVILPIEGIRWDERGPR
jgi:hypothetical protein